jgi:hypothetical protein
MTNRITPWLRPATVRSSVRNVDKELRKRTSQRKTRCINMAFSRRCWNCNAKIETFTVAVQTEASEKGEWVKSPGAKLRDLVCSMVKPKKCEGDQSAAVWKDSESECEREESEISMVIGMGKEDSDEEFMDAEGICMILKTINDGKQEENECEKENYSSAKVLSTSDTPVLIGIDKYKYNDEKSFTDSFEKRHSKFEKGNKEGFVKSVMQLVQIEKLSLQQRFIPSKFPQSLFCYPS